MESTYLGCAPPPGGNAAQAGHQGKILLREIRPASAGKKASPSVARQGNNADEQQFPLYPEYPNRSNASRMKSCLMTPPAVV
jgi:hypothetical protein